MADWCNVADAIDRAITNSNAVTNYEEILGLAIKGQIGVTARISNER